MERGILVNPNEKFYVSVAHTGEDIDRTLDAVEEAFAALRNNWAMTRRREVSSEKI